MSGYDFGYGFLWNYGHLLALVPSLIVFGIALRFKWPRFVSIAVLLVAAWALIGLLIVQVVVRINRPLELPTQAFLTEGSGRVLDGGAGSGRASLMVLLERPKTSVVGVDLYDGYFGIGDNTPERLMRNAEKAGVADRIEATAGDLTKMSFADASFDAAVSAYVIDHLSSEAVEKSLLEIERVLRPGGEFLMMVINPDPWIRVAYPFFVHHGYFGGSTNHERWRARLEDAGLEVVEMDTTPGTLYLLAKKDEQTLPTETGG